MNSDLHYECLVHALASISCFSHAIEVRARLSWDANNFSHYIFYIFTFYIVFQTSGTSNEENVNSVAMCNDE